MYLALEINESIVLIPHLRTNIVAVSSCADVIIFCCILLNYIKGRVEFTEAAH